METRRVAMNFTEWLTENGYITIDEINEDIDDIIEDFNTLKDNAPRLFNLLRDISDR